MPKIYLEVMWILCGFEQEVGGLKKLGTEEVLTPVDLGQVRVKSGSSRGQVRVESGSSQGQVRAKSGYLEVRSECFWKEVMLLCDLVEYFMLFNGWLEVPHQHL